MFVKDKNFTKTIVALAIPVALQNLITAILNIFDQIMVGSLPTLVDESLSAVLLANQIVFLFQIVVFATCHTVNIFVAQYTENGKNHLIPNRVGAGMIVNVLVGIIFTVLSIVIAEQLIGMFMIKVDNSDIVKPLAVQFLKVVSISYLPMAISMSLSFVLRAIKRMRAVLICNCIAVVLNVFLNYIFMFGKLGMPVYGFIGAAYGTVISRFVEMFMIILVLVIFKYPVIAKPSVMFKPDREFSKSFFKIFFPILFNEVSWAISQMVFTFVYASQPNHEVVLAAVNITSSVDKIISVVMIGIGNAAGIMLSNSIGNKDKEQIKTYPKYSIQFGIVVGFVVGLITLATAFFAPQMFPNASSDAQYMAKVLIIIYAVAAISRTINFVLIVGILRSGGDTTFCFIAESVLIWFIGMPLILVGGLVFHWNAYILTSIIMLTELLKTITVIIRIRGNKWLKVVT